MNRRSILFGLASISGVSASAIGTGAFSTTEADRTVHVESAADDSALIRIEPNDTFGRGRTTSGSDWDESVATFNLPGLDEPTHDGEAAEGLGIDSVYRFNNMLTIRNKGSQAVEISSESGESDVDVNLYDAQNDEVLIRGENSRRLEVAESAEFGFSVDTKGASATAYEETLSIIAEAE